MVRRTAAIAWLIGGGFAFAQETETDQGRAPRVVSISPADGAKDVSPEVSELRVRFDMPMSPAGYSFVGGGPTFPQATGTPQWVDAYTCVLPVRLKPNREYTFSINSDRHRNFRSIRLVPAEPASCHFKTGGPAEVAPSPGEQRELNVRSYDALCEAMRRGYSHIELRGVDWEKVFAEHREEVVAAANANEWSRLAANMLSTAKDVHLSLEFDDTPYPTTIRSVTPNFSLASVRSAIPLLVEQSPNVATGLTSDGIGYLLIGTWANESSGELGRIREYLDGMKDATGLILDVRPNAGGSESLAMQTASAFVDEPRVYAKHVYRRGPGPEDFTPARERTISPVDASHRFKEPVAVLMGRANMSSCESFLLMMRQCPRATLIGERSYGSSGNPKPVFLPNGVKALIPSWIDMDADGTVIEGRGVKPDIEVASDGVDFSREDPVLTRALHLLRQGAETRRK